MASEQFKSQLNNFKIDLDEDAIDYIGGMLGDMTLTDHEEVRESTETFLMDASINDMTRNAFYKALFSSKLFHGKDEAKADKGPILLSEKPKSQKQQVKKVKLKNESFSSVVTNYIKKRRKQ